MDTDTVDFTVVKFDLDVNIDGDLDDPEDGVANYLPGYELGQPQLDNGDFNNLSFDPQLMYLTLDGIGVNHGIDAVKFRIIHTTDFPGFAENASDPSIEGSEYDNDYSFAHSSDLSVSIGLLGSGLSYTAFWAKDYGGRATVAVDIIDVKNNGQTLTLFTRTIDVPQDDDVDDISDSWEKQKVVEWNDQFGTAEPEDTTFFSSTSDKELRDPDGAGNTDGGHNMPLHAAAGDSLTVKQEYRGFVMDGGHGFIAARHTRLTPAYKELLIEADMMDAVPHMPSPSIMPFILDAMVAGIEHSTNGAGIHAYWILDEEFAAPYTIFANDSDRSTWAAAHRNPDLSEFVHLMFVDRHSDYPEALGNTPTGLASFVNITTIWNDTLIAGYDFYRAMETVAVHEITHLLLNTNGVNGFDGGEHVPDPDPTDPPLNANDLPYLMHSVAAIVNRSSITYSDVTRSQLTLISKESVER